MTDVLKLFSGIGVVIDDSIFDTRKILNGIQKITESLSKSNVPLLKYNELPDDVISQFHSISFVILDWNLSGERPIPDATINDNIAFIKKLYEICFVPIFIFSDENTHDIQIILEQNHLFYEYCPIFIKKKDEIDTSEKLFNEIGNWIKNVPSIYILKEWENATRKAKTSMLWALSSAHPAWPNVLMSTIQDDGGDKNIELVHLLQNCLTNRICAPQFDTDIIKKQVDSIIKRDLRKILECERFVQQSGLPDCPFAGDIYFIEDKYYLNIRPDCDIIRERKEMYLICGKSIDETLINSDVQNAIRFDSGEFIEKKNSCYVAFVQDHILEFSFRKLTIKKWTEIKSMRIGKLLPPYITKIQQKYSAYLQRQGLPSIPQEAIL